MSRYHRTSLPVNSNVSLLSNVVSVVWLTRPSSPPMANGVWEGFPKILSERPSHTNYSAYPHNKVPFIGLCLAPKRPPTVVMKRSDWPTTSFLWIVLSCVQFWDHNIKGVKSCCTFPTDLIRKRNIDKGMFSWYLSLLHISQLSNS